MTTSNIFILLACLSMTLANPKKYNPEDSFKPSAPLREQLTPRKYNDAPSTDLFRNDTRSSDSHNRIQRFGIAPSAYGPSDPSGGPPGYPGTGTALGSYPVKVDIGGIALGALLGLSIILIAPKIAQLVHGGFGGSYRSLDQEESSITSILSKLDNTLEEHDIDSSSCMQRIVCSYVYEAQKNMKNEESGPIDEFINYVVNNPVLTFMLDGSAIKLAVDMGKQNDPEKCTSLYSKCAIGKEKLTDIVNSLLPTV